MNKITQTILSIAGILIIITCIVILCRKSAPPAIEFIQEWESIKQEAVEREIKRIEETTHNKEHEPKQILYDD